MLTAKQNVLETLKPDGKPDRLVNGFVPFVPIMSDPIYALLRGNRVKGKTTKDVWGTEIAWPEGQHAAMPHVTNENKVLKDITKWREILKIPDVAGAGKDPAKWETAKSAAAAAGQNDKLSMGFMGTGVFEQLHFLMGFEDTLANLLEEPEAMHELIAYITEFKKTQIRLIIDNLHPDVIMFHDDWGSKYNLFMRPTVWREFFKQPYKEIYGLMKKHGIITMHHADCYCQPIEPDMVEVGIDIWEGILPSNDIQQIKKDTGYKLTLMGGIDASIVDTPDWTEDVVRAEVARACRDYSEGGCFIPCLTYGGEGSIHPGVNDIIMDEIRKQNKIYFK